MLTDDTLNLTIHPAERSIEQWRKVSLYCVFDPYYFQLIIASENTRYFRPYSEDVLRPTCFSSYSALFKAGSPDVRQVVILNSAL